MHLANFLGGQRDCSGGVATKGCQHKAPIFEGWRNSAVLIERSEIKVTIGNRQVVPDPVQSQGSGNGLAYQAVAIRQSDEGLGMRRVRNGPEPSTRTTANNYWNKGQTVLLYVCRAHDGAQAKNAYRVAATNGCQPYFL
jgi:hypothetical protein